MKKLTIIILTVFLQSCITTSLQPVSKEFEFKKVLSDTLKSYIYRAKVNLYENDLSGMIVIKPQANSHRIVFINEIGMKFFDIEIFSETYKIHHIFEPMNKKMFVKLLVSDFRFILMQNINSEIKYLRERKSGSDAVKPKGEKEIYYFNRQTHLPQKAVRYSLIRKNTFLTYEEYKGEIPEKISIKHKNIKFVMKMTFIK